MAVNGTLRVHPRGFGFVTVENTQQGRPVASPTSTTAGRMGQDADVFVPGPLLRGCFDGDLVTVEVDPVKNSARSCRLQRRVRTTVIGVVEQDGAKVKVDPGVGVDVFALPSKLPGGSLVRFVPDGTRAVKVELLGSSDDPAAAMLRFLDRHGIPHDRPADVLNQAVKAPRLGPLGARRDLRQQTVVTVDADSSRDLDDALSASVERDGSIRLWVHIADVAEHVRAGSPVDRAAADVPTSVYLPQGVRHMLPDVLGADRLSLLPGKERDTLTVEFRVMADGSVRGVDVYEARILSRQRLNYGLVARVLDGRPVDLDQDLVLMLQVLRTAGVRLGLQRVARGGLDSSRVDGQRTTGPADQADSSSHLLIERLMVAANEAVAGWLADRNCPALWRVHDPIDAAQAEELERVAAGFGVVAALGSPVSPQALASTVSQVPSGPSGSAFWDALLSVLGRARYSVEHSGHFGLGSDGYLHFTSPLRRYPDLLVHRIVKGYLHGRRDEFDTAWLDAVAAHANDVFARAARVERDATLALQLGNVSPGMIFDGTVVGTTRGGVKVRLDGVPVLVVVPGNLRPGSRQKVRILSVDPNCGRVDVELEERSKVPAPRRRRS